LFKAFGLAGVSDYRLHVEITGNELILDSTLAVSDLDQGLFSLLDTSPEKSVQNGLLPRPFSSFMVGQINLARFWGKLPEIIGAAHAASTDRFAMTVRAIQQNTGLDIGQDLLAYIGPQFVVSTRSQNEKQSWVIALELSNEQALEQSLDSLFSSPMALSWGNFIATSDFRGHVFRCLKAQDPEANPTALSTANGQLLIGNADLVRETIQQLESSTNPQPSTMERITRKHAPANAFGLGATDHRNTTSVMYIKMSDSSFSAGLGISGGQDSEKEKEELGENEISLNYIASFLQNSYHFAEVVPGGIHHRIVLEYQNPQGEKHEL